jgi:hypothetical protein
MFTAFSYHFVAYLVFYLTFYSEEIAIAKFSSWRMRSSPELLQVAAASEDFS